MRRIIITILPAPRLESPTSPWDSKKRHRHGTKGLAEVSPPGGFPPTVTLRNRPLRKGDFSGGNVHHFLGDFYVRFKGRVIFQMMFDLSLNSPVLDLLCPKRSSFSRKTLPHSMLNKTTASGSWILGVWLFNLRIFFHENTHTRKLPNINFSGILWVFEKKAFELKHKAVEASNDNPILAITFRQTNTAMETQSLEDVSMMYISPIENGDVPLSCEFTMFHHPEFSKQGLKQRKNDSRPILTSNQPPHLRFHQCFYTTWKVDGTKSHRFYMAPYKLPPLGSC